MRPTEEPLLLEGARALLPAGASPAPVACLVENGRIAALGPHLEVPANASKVDAHDLWLLPGWIDVQVNDIAWLAGGRREPEEHARRVREVLRYQAPRGVTGVVLATLAAPVEDVLSYLKGMREVLEHQQTPLDGVFLGAVVEGTFMNPEYHGAHNPRWVLPLERALLDRFIDSRAVRMINIAPEVAPNAPDLIAHAARRGVVVGCGHAKPHAERLREAVVAGLRYIIHLGNGPTGSSWKGFHDGGMLEESLRNDDLVVTVIADSYHVHPQLLRDWIARKEISRVVAVSDAGFATGFPSGEFEVFGVRGEVAEGGAYLRLKPDREVNPYSSDAAKLFGSAIGMRGVFENLLNLLTREMEGVYYRHHPALAFDEALDAAARICSSNPARLLGLDDRGALERNRRADMVLARVEGGPGAYRVEVKSSFTAGHAAA